MLYDYVVMNEPILLKDDQYPFTYTDHVREIARAIVTDGKGNYAVHFLKRDDMFGHFDYYETPGGGVDKGETPEQAVVRECREELGYAVEVVAFLGEVDDFYNLIHRNNHNHFFLCERKGPFLGTHFVSAGDNIIKKTLWLPIEQILGLYAKAPQNGVPLLVERRECHIWERALHKSEGK
jgi:8-oxo-dGTP diphosphatase